ncbi:MAG: IS30 family transposase [Patescibacteria group bacterium]|jgi:IS30 family transposase
MQYKQLTAAARGAIEVLLQENYTQSKIAEKLGVDPGTVSREIKRGSTPNGYFASVAQERHLSLREKCRKKKKLDYSKRQKYLTRKLQLGWSPEQISGRLKLEESELYICKETIYEYIYEDPWAKKETLYQYLRYGRKKRKKQTGRSVQRSKIPNRVSIHERPEIVGQREEYGHGEGDSVIFKNKMAINTINELKTGVVRFTKLDRKTANQTAQAMIRRIRELRLKTCTVDNGSEFTNHEQVTQETKTRIYFADPYSSWQRGSNENTNMLLRGYLPKRADISDLTQEELDDIAQELNNRPRKRLGYQTPNEVYQMLKCKKGEKVAVAIRI